VVCCAALATTRKVVDGFKRGRLESHCDQVIIHVVAFVVNKGSILLNIAYRFRHTFHGNR